MQMLLAKGPLELGAWFDAQGSGPTFDETVHWHGLAEAAAQQARAEVDLDWAALAIRLYAHWGCIMGDSATRSGRLSVMFMRAWLIRKLGAEPGDPVLDIHTLASQFEEDLTLSITEASALALTWRTQDIAVIRELRGIKNQLGPFELLDPQLLSEIPRVRDWLVIRSQLP
ncbi:hypothetical protein ACSFCA_33040 [Variovorax sp. ZT5R36]